MSDLTTFLKATGNEFAAVAEEGIAAGDVSGYYDTGSYTLNALISGSIYGGVPDSKATGYAAESSVGKTMLALSVLRQFQIAEPTGLANIFESESAISKQMLVERGIDVSRVGIVPCITLQDFRASCIKIIDNYEKEDPKTRTPLFFVLDSLGNLSTEKEMTDALAGNNTKDMTRASLVRSVFRVITLKLGRSRIPFVVTNHVYASIGSLYAGNEIGGGGGFKYACSTIITMTKAQDKDGDEIKGAIVTCTTHKSRLTREKLKIKTRILHQAGLDRYYGLVPLAVDAGLLVKNSTRLQWADTGEKVFETTINKDPKKYWTQERLGKIEEYVKSKFLYVSDVEVDEPELDATGVEE